MPRVSYCTIGFGDRSLEAALAAIAEAGFAGVELDCDPHAPGPPGRARVREIVAALESFGLRATTIHAPLGRHTLGAPAEDWRCEVARLLMDYLRLAADVGASGMVIHPVPNPKFLPDGALDSHYQPMRLAARRSLDELIPVAENTGQRILLENLPYLADAPGRYPLTSMEQLRPWIENDPPARVGLVFDTGHAWTSGLDPVAEIIAAGDRLCATHLQDVDGIRPNDDHWVPTHGGLDWQAIRAALQQVDYRGVWTFEVINARYGESREGLARLSREVANDWGL